MKKKLSAAGLLAVIASLLCNLTGCGGVKPDPTALTAGAADLTQNIKANTVQGKAADADFIAAQTAFALRLMQQTCSQKQNANVLISPYSAMQALAMTANGAKGKTREEMAAVLGTDIDTLNAYLYTLRTGQQNTADAKLTTANSIWFRDDRERFHVLPEFLQTNADYYAADAYSAPFTGATVSAINAWVNSRTDGMIPKLVNEIKDDEVMYLINAVAFDAKWEKKYQPEDIEERQFTLQSGSQQKVQMMYSDESKYLETAHATGFIKPYLGGKYAFAALLPEEGLSPAGLLADMTPEELASLLASPQSCKVHAGLPQYTFDYDTDFTDALKNMGMKAAFAFEDADFSGISDNDAPAISKVIQKTHIEVDANGTKAAAATAVVMTDGCAPVEEEMKYVILNRPFVCMILDTENNLPVFIGTVNAPE